jgi:hypothetical protein
MAEPSAPSRYPAAAELEPSDAERRVIDAATRGEPAVFDGNGPQDARTLRAEVLTALLLGLRDDWPVDPRGLRVAGAVVTGPFDLSYARNPATGGPAAPSFVFTRCTFAEPVDLTAACLDHVVFENCALPRLDAPSLRCARVVLKRSRIDGVVDLHSASIEGPVDATFAEGVTGFDLAKSRVGGEVLFAAISGEGEVATPRSLRLVDADIGGGVVANKRTFDRIEAWRARVGAHVLLDNAAVTSLDILGARIGGQLAMEGAKLRNAGKTAIYADRAEIVGGVFLRTTDPDAPFVAEGEIRLLGARIGGQLGMNGANLRNAAGTALDAEDAEIGGVVFLRDDDHVPFSSVGLIRFDYARLGGLDAGGAQLGRGEADPEDKGSALHMAFARIEGPLRLRASVRRPFACRGRIDLTGVRVEGDVDLRGGVFVAEDRGGESEDRRALCLDRADLRSTVRFGARRGFTSVVVGAASFDGARLAKDLVLTDGVFRVDAGDDPLAAGAEAPPGDDGVTRRKLGVCLSLQGALVEGLLHSKRFGPRAALTTAAEGLGSGEAADHTVATLRHAQDTAAPDDGAEDGDGLQPNGLFDLTGAQIGTIADHPLHGWPQRDGLLELDGSTYTGLELLEPPPDDGWRSWLRRARHRLTRRQAVRGDETARIWERRLEWLHLQWPGTRPGREHFKPQPFEQLAKVLRAMGHGHDADRIAVEKRRFALACRADRGVAFALNWILAKTSDFGYGPGRAILLVVAAVVLGYAAMAAGVAEGGLALKDGEASVAADQPLALLLYAVDAFLPFLSLSGTPELNREATHWGFQLFLLAYNLAGIVLTSILVVTLTGLLRKD